MATIPCSDCVTGSIHAGTVVGSVIRLPLKGSLGEINCYYSPPPSSIEPQSTATIIMLSDAFGYSFINSQLIADKYAKEGFHVYLPDYFQGDSMSPDSLDVLEKPPSTTWQETFYNAYQTAVLIPTFMLWISRHHDANAIPLVWACIEKIKEISAEKGTNGKLATIGFCFGGRYSILAAGGTEPLVDAYAVAHPSQVAVPKDILDIKRPGLFLLAETDVAFGESAEKNTRLILESRAAEAPTEFVKYPGTKHGFATRGSKDTDEARAAATSKAIEFFKAKLLV